MGYRGLFVTATAAWLLAQTAAWADVTVFRAVDRKNGDYAKINDAQWRIDSDGMSTFEAAGFFVTNKACQVSFNVQGVNSVPPPGTAGQIEHMPIGYMGVYTPQHGGLGHWSLQAPPGTPDATFKTEITNYVIMQQAAGKNPHYKGSSESLCKTPAGPNLARHHRRHRRHVT